MWNISAGLIMPSKSKFGYSCNYLWLPEQWYCGWINWTVILAKTIISDSIGQVVVHPFTGVCPPHATSSHPLSMITFGVRKHCWAAHSWWPKESYVCLLQFNFSCGVGRVKIWKSGIQYIIAHCIFRNSNIWMCILEDFDILKPFACQLMF